MIMTSENKTKHIDIFTEWQQGASFYYCGQKLTSCQAQELVNFAGLKSSEVAFSRLYTLFDNKE